MNTTLQPILDFVSRHLFTQNAKAIDDSGICKYLTPKGLKCAVGCLIRNYNRKLEDKAIDNHSFKEEFNTAFSYELNEEEVSLLYRLQVVHDRHAVVYWESELRQLAINHKLQPFSRCDLSSGRGIEHPFPLRSTTAQQQRPVDQVS